jgi:hypothetical protein
MGEEGIYGVLGRWGNEVMIDGDNVCWENRNVVYCFD